MTDQQMLDQSLILDRESLDRIHSRGYLLKTENNMAEQLPAIRVMNGAFVRQLIELSDVVQDRSRKQQINIQFTVMLSHQAAQITQADNVLKKAAQESVVHHLRR